MNKVSNILLSIILVVTLLCSSLVCAFAIISEIQAKKQPPSNEIPFTRIDVSDRIKKTPEESLSKPTKELFEDMLEYEVCFYPFHSSTLNPKYNSGYSVALQELETRYDAGSVLLNKYFILSEEYAKHSANAEYPLSTKDHVDLLSVEYLLQQEIFLNKLSLSELKTFKNGLKETPLGMKNKTLIVIDEEFASRKTNYIIGAITLTVSTAGLIFVSFINKKVKRG